MGVLARLSFFYLLNFQKATNSLDSVKLGK